MTFAYLVFFVLAFAAVASAVGLLLSRNAVYAALFLIVNFASVAVIYLSLGAPFIALAQVTVYAGAIMILFLFVIMLLGAEKLPLGSSLPWQRPVGIVLGVVLLAEAVYIIVFRSGVVSTLAPPAADFASPKAIGVELFNHYLLPFEVTSILLLVAMVGAIVLTRVERKPAGRRLVSSETSAAPSQANLLGYEEQVEADEKRGEFAGPGPADVDRR